MGYCVSRGRLAVPVVTTRIQLIVFRRTLANVPGGI